MDQNNGLRQKKSIQVKTLCTAPPYSCFNSKVLRRLLWKKLPRKQDTARATFFNHFGNKHGVLRHYGQELRDIVEEILEHAEPETSSLDLLCQVLLAMTKETREHIEEVRLISNYSVRDPSYMTNPTPSRKRILEIITQLVSQAQQEAEIRTDLSARDLGLHIFLLYQGVVFALAVTGVENADSLQHSMWQFILEVCVAMIVRLNTGTPPSDNLAVGGKGAGLIHLVRLEMPVPKAIILEATAYSHHARRCDLFKK